jgi:hypothetical protein
MGDKLHLCAKEGKFYDWLEMANKEHCGGCIYATHTHHLAQLLDELYENKKQKETQKNQTAAQAV